MVKTHNTTKDDHPPPPSSDNGATHASMEDDKGDLDGGIKDDDISKTKTHDDSISSPSGTTSPAANLNNDL